MKKPIRLKPVNVTKPIGRPKSIYYRGNVMQNGGKLSKSDQVLLDTVLSKGLNVVKNDSMLFNRAKILLAEHRKQNSLQGIVQEQNDPYAPQTKSAYQKGLDNYVQQEIAKGNVTVPKTLGQKIYRKLPLQAQMALDLANLGLETTSIPAAALAETSAALSGQDYNYKNILPTELGGNQRSIGDVAGIENPYLKFGVDLVTDPTTWVGAGYLKHLNDKNLVKANSLSSLEDFKSRISTEEGKRRLQDLQNATNKIYLEPESFETSPFIKNNNAKLQQMMMLPTKEGPYYWDYLNTVFYNNKVPVNYAKPISRHEMEHGVQNIIGGKNKLTSIDKSLDNLELVDLDLPAFKNYSLLDKVYNKLYPFSYKTQIKKGLSNRESAIDYFETGSNGREKSPFLAELQQYLVDNKHINHPYDYISPELIKEVHTSKKNYPLRILDIITPTDKNYDLLSSNLNKMLNSTGAIGTGALLNQDKEVKQLGGPVLLGMIPATLSHYATNYPVTTKYINTPGTNPKDIEGLYGFEQSKNEVRDYISSPHYRSKLQNELDKSDYGDNRIKPTAADLQQAKLATLNTIPTKHYRDINYFYKQPSEYNLGKEAWEDAGHSVGQATVLPTGYKINEQGEKIYSPKQGYSAYNPKFGRQNANTFDPLLKFRHPSAEEIGKNVGREEYLHITQNNLETDSPFDYLFTTTNDGIDRTKVNNTTPYAHKILQDVGYKGEWDKDIQNMQEYFSRPHEVDAKIKAGKAELLAKGIMKPGESFKKKHFKYMLDNPNMIREGVLNYMTGKANPTEELNKRKNVKLRNETFKKFKLLHDELAQTDNNSTLPIVQNGGYTYNNGGMESVDEWIDTDTYKMNKRVILDNLKAEKGYLEQVLKSEDKDPQKVASNPDRPKYYRKNLQPSDTGDAYVNKLAEIKLHEGKYNRPSFQQGGSIIQSESIYNTDMLHPGDSKRLSYKEPVGRAISIESFKGPKFELKSSQLCNPSSKQFGLKFDPFKRQLGGNIANTPTDYSEGLNKGVNIFPFNREGLKKMTMSPESGNIEYPVKYEGYTKGVKTDEGVAKPGQDFNVNGDTVVEKPDLTHIKDWSKAFDYAVKMNLPIFVWRNQEYPVKK